MEIAESWGQGGDSCRMDVGTRVVTDGGAGKGAAPHG